MAFPRSRNSWLMIDRVRRVASSVCADFASSHVLSFGVNQAIDRRGVRFRCFQCLPHVLELLDGRRVSLLLAVQFPTKFRRIDDDVVFVVRLGFGRNLGPGKPPDQQGERSKQDSAFSKSEEIPHGNSSRSGDVGFKQLFNRREQPETNTALYRQHRHSVEQ
jgi:hypothetical protein